MTTVVEANYEFLGYTKVTVSTTKKGLAEGTVPAVPDGATHALIQCAAAEVRFHSGGEPTPALGIRLPADKDIWYSGPLRSVKFIRTGDTDAVLDVEFYRARSVPDSTH